MTVYRRYSDQYVTFFVDEHWIKHGEYESETHIGRTVAHRYYHNGEIVHDFIASPLDDIGRMVLYLKYGHPLFDTWRDH